MTAVVLRADARELPLPDSSVDLVVTSPPYFGLRSYTDGGEHYDGQIGSEATPAAWVAALLDCTREWVRVLKPSGSLWVNLGDKYAQDTERHRKGLDSQVTCGRSEAMTRGATIEFGRLDNGGIPRKSLMGLPWRYALACIDQLGLILRAEVIWSKPNGLPESVTDRVRRSHEQLFHFTRMPRYYSAVDEIREAQKYPGDTGRESFGQTWRNASRQGLLGNDGKHSWGERNLNPLGKLPGSVWTIPSQPLTVPPEFGVDHFAAFPMELPRRIIQGWSPPGICAACGEGRRPVADSMIQRRNDTTNAKSLAGERLHPGNRTQHTTVVGWKLTTITGYVCACPTPDAPTRPAVVLDPFGGTGTTALIAHVLGRTGISVDRSADYCRLARWRTTDPGERARAMQVPKPQPQLPGQGELDLMEASS